MVATLRGKIIEMHPDYVVLETSCGVGFQLFCSSVTLSALSKNEETFVHCYMLVREDAMTLFGFATPEEKRMFELLITVSGVGPRMAQSTLSTLNPSQLAIAIATGDESAFVKVSGVGKKLSQRIILELKEKIGKEAPGMLQSTPAAVLVSNDEQEAVTALLALGYTLAEATYALSGAPQGDIQQVLKYALKQLGSR